jgi:hypothetical protein
MSETEPAPEPPPTHESPEIATRRTALVSAAIAGALLAVLGLAAAVLGLLGGTPEPVVQALPPAPRLAGDPRRDLLALRQREDALLTQYAWVDRDAEVVRIPIERAMQALVERERRK